MALKLNKTNLVRNLAVKHKLVPHLERAIGEGDFTWTYDYSPKVGDDGWHPSGDCMPSLNELYHRAKSYVYTDPLAMADTTPAKHPPALYKTFQVGHFWHQYLQYLVEHKLKFCGADDIERRGVKCWGFDPDRLAEEGHHYYERERKNGSLQPKVRPKPFHWATGSGDLAPCKVPGYGKYIVDFKTMREGDFKQMHVPNWCADKYEAQINIYMDFFDMDQGMIVAIQKDSPHGLKEFCYERNQPLIDAIYQKWELVSQCLEADIEPPEDEVIELPFTGPV